MSIITFNDSHFVVRRYQHVMAQHLSNISTQASPTQLLIYVWLQVIVVG